ncbi:hypothetical protein [Natronomonas salsuginis]|jgi:hypothetical protein|uniref:SCP2 sterol-binding domain-containing protein n=1 Tax=Natronomonas salsuginis TaxID=2217661 RepID=A0A4U5JK24_9EURY|nr:hypothetical protein [Natronomonas salsuginis]TKR28127.1 hypothetical protein DM868_03340 [Natronomonas salsuginis]
MPNRRTVIISGLLVMTLLMFPVGTVSAQECSLDADQLNPLVDVYNENLDQVPGLVKGQLSDQRIDVRIDAADGERRFAVSTDSDGRVTQFEEAVAEDPTVRVETDESTTCDVITSDDPAATFNQAYENGDIEVTGVGVTNRVKIGAVKVGVSVVKSLSGLF